MLRFTRFFVALLALTLFADASDAQEVTLPIMPAKGYDVNYYNATLWLDRAKDSLSGKVEMTATSMGQLSQILQHAKNLTIDSVFVDGVRASTVIIDTLSGAYNIIGYPANYHNGSEFVVRTYYHGKATNEGGAKAWGGVQNMGGMMFSMGVGFTAPYISCTRHWLPCYDEPDDKADSVTLRFFADTSGIVVSNGLQTGYLLEPDNKTTFTEWTVSHKIATYLLTFAFGPFQKVSIANPLNIPFDVYGFSKDTAKLRMLMQKRVVEALVYFDSLIGSYPFEKVGYVVAPIGSMEHQTMITLVNQALDTNSTTAVHELSHMWFGDEVTCYDFNDAWLNEGFATYCESLFLERFSGEAQYWTRQHSNIAGSLLTQASTIPLHGAPFYTVPRNNYPPAIYQKGAAVIGMMRYIFGDSAFFAVMRGYVKSPTGTMSSAELGDGLSIVTNSDVGWFFNKWVFGIGNPIYNILWSRNGGNVTMRIEQIQDSIKVGYFRLPLIIEARAAGGKTERHKIQLDSIRFNEIKFENSFVPDTLVIDPDGAIIKKIIGPVKLGVIAAPNLVQENDIFAVRFNPNPSNSHKMTVTISGIPIRMVMLDAGNTELMIFDTNGNNVSLIKLDHRNNSGSPQNGDYSYSIDTGSLASGTYFATLLLNGATIGGKGSFVVTK